MAVKYECYTRNFVFGGRGPSSAVMIRKVDDPNNMMTIGTIYYLDVHGAEHITTASEGAAFCSANAEIIFERLRMLEDDGIVPGWSGRPWTEQGMIDAARKEAGWEYYPSVNQEELEV